MIEVKNLTMQYPNGKGIFHITFSVKQGQVMGYLGPNGAGKTTTIRALMGFMKPNDGICTIDGKNCFTQAAKIQQSVGYLPGEIAFVEGMTGEEYLAFIAAMRGMKSDKRKKQLLELLEFSPKGNIRKFSKGMKQKLAIVAAFMHDPAVLILDEPTGGLDPLMQNRFIELIADEKRRGKTILMSSHMFEEIERTCDNVLIIKNGQLVSQSDIQTLKNNQRKTFLLKTPQMQEAIILLQENGFAPAALAEDSLEVMVTGQDIGEFAKLLGRFEVADMEIKAQSLEEAFLHFYAKGGK